MGATLPPFFAKNAIPGVYNYDHRNFPNLLRGLDDMRAGNANLKIGMVGDSIFWGQGTDANNTGAAQVRAGQRVAEILAGNGIAASAENFIGSGNWAASTFPTQDSRLVPGAGWVTNNTINGPGGWPWDNSTDTSILAFTPIQPCDRADIYYLRDSGMGVFSWAVDAGAATQVNQAGATSIQKATVSLGTLGAHTLKIARVSGQCRILGVSCYSSAKKCAEVMTVAVSGYLSADVVQNFRMESPLNAIPALGLHLAVVNLTTNDRAFTANPAAAMANLQTFINTMQANNTDVWLFNPNPSNPATSGSQAVQDAYDAAMLALANKNNLVLIDGAWADQTWAQWNGRGKAFDDLHPNARGHAEIGRLIAIQIAKL